MRRSKVGAEYPADWAEIAQRVKDEAGWKCVRCGIAHQAGHVLTVHHLDMDPSNCEWWNLLPLCQQCHLTIQAKVVIERYWMFEHSEWFRPYAAGYYAGRLGLPTDREWVMNNVEEVLEIVRREWK